MHTSHPSWVRGLKYWRAFAVSSPSFVASFMGAWIEIISCGEFYAMFGVASFMGAWIEIDHNA